MEDLYDIMDEFGEEFIGELSFNEEIIIKNHKTAEMLSKKGYKVKKPLWDGLIAS